MELVQLTETTMNDYLFATWRDYHSLKNNNTNAALTNI